VGIVKVSARNILKGKVKRLVNGPVNTEVTVRLSGGEEVVSTITRASAEELELKEGKEVYAVIKASHVMIAIE
jgi:molybdopterin-binding protein